MIKLIIYVNRLQLLTVTLFICIRSTTFFMTSTGHGDPAMIPAQSDNYASAPIGSGIKRCFCLTSDVCLTSVCLSVAYVGPNSRTEKPRKED